MSETSLVPALEKSLALGSVLKSLHARAEAIVVVDADSYATACQIALDGRAYIKKVGFELDPGIQSAKDHLDLLKNQKAKFVDPAKEIVEVAARKAEAWKAEERRKAEAEQERINAERRREAARLADEERRKADAAAAEQKKLRDAQIEEARKAGEINKREAARLEKQAEQDRLAARELARKQELEAANSVQEIKIAPSVPKVAGIKARVNWKFRIVDASKLPRQFLMPDEVAIGQHIRAEKRAGEVIPGVEAYSEDGI